MSFTCSKLALFCVFYSTFRGKKVGGGGGGGHSLRENISNSLNPYHSYSYGIDFA